MDTGVVALFTGALKLSPPWEIGRVELRPGERRIDFELRCPVRRLACPHCGLGARRVQAADARRSWRHADLFEFEAWVHASVPHVDCLACGRTGGIEVPWMQGDSGFMALE